MSIEYTPEGVLKQSSISFLKRVIGQALTEGASEAQVDAYLQGMGVEQFEKYRLQIMQKKALPLLYGAELQKMGGRNKFRTHFGLPPIEQLPEQEYDFPLSESGDVEHFASLYSEELKYDHLRGRWLISDDESGLWLPDNVGRITGMALKSNRKRQANALTHEDHGKRKAMGDWAFNGESRSRLSNLVAMGEDHPDLSDDGMHWDEDPFLLGTPTGVVDLRTGEHKRATPEQRITMHVSVPFDAKAECPLWLKTLADIFAGHEVKSEDGSTSLLEAQPVSESQKIIDFIQRAMGYSITGDCREECCFFAWGDGGNGKGTIINTIGALVKDYLDDMPYQTLEKSLFKSQTIPNDVAKLAGKRFITCAEMNEFTLNEARLKALTGRDPITARFLNKEFFTFRPVGKIWISTNNKPRITGLDQGIWRRIHLIPFTNSFKGPNEDKTLKDRLLAELPGILNWLIAGTQAWLAQGLNPPETVRVATEEYRRDSEPITPFIESCCVVASGCKVKAGEVYKAYVDFASGQRDDATPLNEKQFLKLMKSRYKFETGRHTVFIGIGLIERAEGQRAADPGF